MITKELQDNTLQLNVLDKIHLVEVIMESLDKPDHNVEKAWIEESERRYQAYKNGKIKGIPYSEITKRLKK